MRRYAGAIAIILLVIEVLIARYAHDRFIRPYLGDVLAVMLVHFALRATIRFNAVTAALIALAIGVSLEVAQGLHLLHLLGLEQVKPARILLGSQFEWLDMLAYLAGAGAAFALDRLIFRRR